MKQLHILLLALVMLLSTADQSSSQMIFGEGTATCGNWMLERSPGQRVTAEGVGFFSWVLGFLSGANANRVGPDFLEQTNPAGILAWMNSYCQGHPLDKIVNAAEKLQNELKARAK
jgi:hypothetical protein